MALLATFNVYSSLLLQSIVFLLAVSPLLPTQGAKLHRRQTNRIECKSTRSQCQFYSHCIDAQFPCGHNGFILSYAEERCERIDRLKARRPGRECTSDSCINYNGYFWAHETDNCLKLALENLFNRFTSDGLRSDPSVCLRWEQEAVEKMNECYSTAWQKFPLSEDDARTLTSLFRMGDYFDSVVDNGIPSLVRRQNSTLANQLSTNLALDRRLFCVRGSAYTTVSGQPTLRDLTSEEAIVVVQNSLQKQQLSETHYHYGGEDVYFEGEPCKGNQPSGINTGDFDFHLVSLFVPHGTNISEEMLINSLERTSTGRLTASMYELSAKSEDPVLSVVENTQCGDGVRHATEECDYGHSTEGCSIDCKIQSGYDCTVDRLQPSTCWSEVCGDGMRTRGEECDDGNSADGDGCNSSCRLEKQTHCCATNYNATSTCQTCTGTTMHFQLAPKQSPSYITARRLSPPAKALAGTHESDKRTVNLPVYSSSLESLSSSSYAVCLFLAILAAVTNLKLWR